LLGLPDDARRYDAAAAMLGLLASESVQLLTNNPAKEEALRTLGVDVVGRVPVLVRPIRFPPPTSRRSARGCDT